jgi:hypothetical protein
MVDTKEKPEDAIAEEEMAGETILGEVSTVPKPKNACMIIQSNIAGYSSHT